MRVFRGSAGLCVLLLAFGMCFPELRAQQPAQEGILFLRLRMAHGSVSLISTTLRPGTLKLPRGSSPSPRLPIAYDLVSSGGATIESGAIPDPAVRRYEYEDPNEPGRLRAIQSIQDTVEFTLRIPAFAGLSRVDFFRVSTAEAGAMAKIERTPIGGVVVIPTRGN